MPENRQRIALEASVLRCGYDVGYFEKKDIERWADGEIAADEKPSLILIELASIERIHPLDVMNLLRSLASDVPPQQSISTQIGFIGIAFVKAQLPLNTAIKALWALLEQPGVTQDQKSEIYMLDDGYDLALIARGAR